jgi:hypothetical protein
MMNKSMIREEEEGGRLLLLPTKEGLSRSHLQKNPAPDCAATVEAA